MDDIDDLVVEHTITAQVGGKKRRAEQSKPSLKVPQVKLPRWARLSALILPAIILAGVLLSASANIQGLEESVRENAQTGLYNYYLGDVQERFPHYSSAEADKRAKELALQELSSEAYESFIQRSVAEEQAKYSQAGGTLYLLGYDAYWYLRIAENMLENGHAGNTMSNGKPFDTLRRAPHGKTSPWNTLSFFEKTWHQAYLLFSPRATLMTSAFYLPVFLGILSTLLLFFIALKIFEQKTAFFASLLFAMHPFFFLQNRAGFTDTTIVIMPLSLGLFLGLLWVLEGKALQRVIGGLGAITSLTLLKLAWSGWYFVLGVMIACALAYAVKELAMKKNHKASAALIGLGLAALAMMWKTSIITKVMKKLRLAEQVPGLQLTVKELGAKSFTEFVQLFGNWLFFILLVIALLILLRKLISGTATTFELFLLVWFVTLLIPSLRVWRYSLFLVPSAVILAGSLMKKMHAKTVNFLTGMRFATRPVISLIVLALMPIIVGATMVNLEQQNYPPLNDSVYQMGTWMKTNTAEDAIINTWWDRGYVWQYVAERSTVLDSTPTTASNYFARALMSENPEHSKNIIRMLTCSGHEGYEEFENLGIRGMALLERGLTSTKEEAEELYPEMIELTHCEMPQTYIIIDELMLTAFGSIENIANWNQTLAVIRDKTQGLEESEAVAKIQQETGWTKEQSESAYHDSIAQSVDSIGRQVSQVTKCANTTEATICSGINIDLDKTEVLDLNKPAKLVIYENGTKTTKNYQSEKNIALIVIEPSKGQHLSILVPTDYSNTLMMRLFAEERTAGFEKAHRTQDPEQVIAYKLDTAQLTT